MKQYHLISACDRNYLPYAFVAYQSVINSIDTTFNTADKDELVFHIIIDETIDEAELKLNTDTFSQRNQDKIACNFITHKIDLSILQALPKWGEHASLSLYYRLLIDKFLDTTIEKILYFDIDVMFNADVRKIFKEYPLSGKVLGAVGDPGIQGNDSRGEFFIIDACSKSQPSIKLALKTYFNSGVLLINMNEWRRRDIGNKSMELGPKYKWIFPDQEILNYLVQDYEPMSWSYNFQPPMFYVEYNRNTHKYDQLYLNNTSRSLTSVCPEKEVYEQISNNPRIIHFTCCKPWGSSNFLLRTNPLKFVPDKMVKALEQWHQISAQTPEYINERSRVETSGEAIIYTGIIRLLISDIDDLKRSIQKINRKRRMMIKLVIASTLLTLILYIIHFAS